MCWNWKNGGHSLCPQREVELVFAFTEMGVAILSTILSSEKAIAVNIQIMRVFTPLRQMLYNDAQLRLEVEKIKQKTENNT